MCGNEAGRVPGGVTMSERRIGVGRLLRLFDVGTVSELSDAESIDRFAVADVDREATEARVGATDR